MDIFKGQNLLEFSDRFKTDLDCKEYLASIKSQTDYKCLKCNHNKCQVRKDFARQCNICGHIESTTANTLFHKVKFGIRKAFFVCFEMSTTTKSLSARYMAVRYGVTERIARLFMMKVRKAVLAHYKMKIQTTILTLLLISFCSCDIQTEDNNDKKNVNNSSIQKSGLNKSDKTDRNKMIEIVADEILNKFQKEQVSKYEFDNDGNFYIELFSDTVSDKSDETYKEYYRINKDDIITGRLNADDKIDFAIKSIWSRESGNIFGIEWHIYVSENNKNKRVKNDFGGGKFSDLETVTEISEMKLTTEFQDFNEETSWLKDSVEFREYQLIDNKLNRLE